MAHLSNDRGEAEHQDISSVYGIKVLRFLILLLCYTTLVRQESPWRRRTYSAPMVLRG